MTRSIISTIGRPAVRQMLRAAAAKAAKENDEVGAPRATRDNGRTFITPGKPIKPADLSPAATQRKRK